MKKIVLVVLLLSSVLLLSGCGKSIFQTYTPDTGDTIEITLKNNGDYSLTSEIPFEVLKNSDVISTGIFCTIDSYKNSIDAVEKDNNSKVIEKNSNKNIEYVFYSYNNSEYNYLIKILNSNTALILGNNISEKDAKDVFERLTIRKID